MMPQIRPISELNDATALSDLCHAHREPVFLTRNGRNDLVVMSVETYEETLEAASLEAEIAQSEAQYERDGRLYDAEEVMARLRKQFFGRV